MLTDPGALERYGADVLHFIPRNWWKFWSASLITELPDYFCRDMIERAKEGVAVVVDVTCDRQSFASCLKSGQLGRLKNGCNRYLRACVLCPWGCSSFLHDAGCIAYDVVMTRFMPFLGFAGKLSSRSQRERVESSREDFFSFHVHMHVFNPKWLVRASVYFDQCLGPVYLTCSDHHGGTRDGYFHVPRTSSCLPSLNGNQLSFVVLRARTLRPARAHAYSNTYQMNLFKGNYSGVDCTWVSDARRRFDFHSHVVDINECRSYRGRDDIRGLCRRLVEENDLSLEYIQQLDERSRQLFPSLVELDSLCRGATFMTLSDVMEMQRSMARSRCREMKVGDPSSDVVDAVATPWPSQLVRIHPYNKRGATPVVLPAMSTGGKKFDCRLLWFLGLVVVNSGCIWAMVDAGVESTTHWSGHFLAYLARYGLRCVKRIWDPRNPFRSSAKGSKPVECCKRLCAFCQNATGTYDLGDYEKLFRSHVDEGQIQFLKFRYMSVLLPVEEECKVLWFLNKGSRNDIRSVPSVLSVLGDTFELRFLASGKAGNPTNPNDWNGEVWLRYGTDLFPLWWRYARRGGVR